MSRKTPLSESYLIELNYDQAPKDEARMRSDVEAFMERLTPLCGKLAYAVVTDLNGPKGARALCTVTPADPVRFKRGLGPVQTVPQRRRRAKRRTTH